ncbi:kinesin-like protein KIN-12E [Ipomoea triloba]|uniref:kinesin-like protein KIN-12E n=1 Tax=Ipomoea triloba TaxID=35885 RepID=UPI00125E04F3|nr:kinesin-like protein KIN-12E [Ipomoea triloba]
MPLISEASSAVKSRFGFHDPHHHHSSSEQPPPLPAVKSSPDLRMLKSACKDRSENSDGDSAQTAVSNQLRSFEFREDPAFWKDHNVQVIIRVRPLNSSEISLYGNSRCLRQDSSQTITWIGHPESRFTFDLIADENVTQEMLFKVSGVPMVENCVEGYNSCMFAYGQTGSGKTHTMLGDIEGGTRRHSVNCGMTPRVFEYLFSRIQKEREARREEKIRFTCRCSFLEIYNEQILDLLDPSSVNLQIREDTKKGIHVENLTEVEVTSARDVIQQLVQGAANRKVAATNMNRASSRSHSVFTCVIESKWESQGVTHHRFARLNLVDLAGSERQKSSGAEGERLKEATNINKSLSTLGLVIMNLVSMSNGKTLHVPYRDSKLTFLLQDSLGGNAKTIIIANVSPSNSCSLETLSTLKFAQRAKFIKNHAVVNEDASGDVIAMRMQIQNLKKEVARLRSVVNGGGDAYETDSRTVALPGSPTSIKWEGLHGFASPLASGKKMSYKKDYEVALVGAFRREKDKDIAMQALVAENQAALQLAKQREDEIQGLKMRLRFREGAIKRLESVASGKISAEVHLLKEKEEQLKEIEVLRNQVDRNQEVTRFAMENLRLKEEIRRLKSFYEEGERERMNEQIMILENQLREALDWKLMHGSDPINTQEESSELATDINNDSNLLIYNQKPATPMHTVADEENEFLRLQAIYIQSELDALRKKLDVCVEEKEKLERHVNDLEKELESERSSKAAILEESHKVQSDLSSLTNCQMPNIGISDQMELEAMVDAIAAASQREAEAHETAISLSKENEELRAKIKVLIEDNQKLIELYEQAVAEKNSANLRCQNCQDDSHKLSEDTAERELQMKGEVERLNRQLMEMHEENEKLMGLYENAMQDKNREVKCLNNQLVEMHDEKELQMKAEVECLNRQLMEMHEENEKLMGLYENAMQAKNREAKCLNNQLVEMHDEKELQMKGEVECLNRQLMEMHEENEKLMGLYENAMQEKSREVKCLNNQLVEIHDENEKLMGLYENAMQEKKGDVERLNNQLMEMHEENDKLMGLYEKAMQERDDFKRLISSTEKKIVEDKGESPKSGKSQISGIDCFTTEMIDSFGSDMQHQSENLYLDEHNSVSANPEQVFEEAGLIEVDVQEEYSQYSYMGNTSDSDEPPFCKTTGVTQSNLSGSVASLTIGEKESGILNDDEMEKADCPDSNQDAGLVSDMDEKSSHLITVDVSEDLELVQRKLYEAQEKLMKSANTVSMFGSLERAFLEVDELSRKVEGLEESIHAKQQGFESFKILSSELLEKKAVVDKKLSALKYSLSSFSSSIGYFELRETQARQRWNTSLTQLDQKKSALSRLQASKDEYMVLQMKAKQSESELISSLAHLKTRLEEENQSLENDRVLFAIDNIAKPDVDPSQRNWHLSGKATELLKSEEEKTKIQNQIKQTQEKLGSLKKEVEDLSKKMAKLEGPLQAIEKEVEKSSKSAKELEVKLQTITCEKEMILKMKEDGKNEFEDMIVEYHQHLFDAALKEEEMKILNEELQMELQQIEDLKREKALATTRKNHLQEALSCQSFFVSDKVGEDLHDIQQSVMELNLLLGNCNSKNS